MDITSLSAISALENVSRYSGASSIQENPEQSSTSFSSLLDSAMNLVKETNDYSNAAEVEKIQYATGQSDNLHDLMIAQQKASVTLQYTVAVKNAAVDAYKTIMNLQF